MRYIYDTVSVNSKSQIHNEVASWAWKENDLSGRVVVTGSHPEDVISGERLEYMASMLLYAMDPLPGHLSEFLSPSMGWNHSFSNKIWTVALERATPHLMRWSLSPDTL